MVRYNLEYFKGILGGSVPVIVWIRKGKVTKLTIDGTGLFTVEGLIEIEATRGEVILSRKILNDWEFRAEAMARRLRKILEEKSPKKERTVISAINKQIKAERLITAEGMYLSESAYIPEVSFVKTKGKINPNKFSGQILAAVDVECDLGSKTWEAEILPSEGVRNPLKKRQSRNKSWEELSEESKEDFANLIAGQPLTEWFFCGEKFTVGDRAQIEKIVRRQIKEGIKL